MAPSGQSFNWFDVAIIVVLGVGLFRGRKNGMSKELIPMLQWVTLVLVCGFGYPLLAQVIGNFTGWSKMTNDLLSYLVLAMAVAALFSVPKRLFTDRLLVSNFFGNTEFYLGMFAGAIRFGCMAVVALALLNAPFYTTADVEEHQAYVERWYGGDYFPSLQSVQDQVFMKSFAGPYIRNGLSKLLINTVPDSKGPQTRPVSSTS